MSDDRPHVLYVAWGFPPGRTGGVYRALATANAFAKAGLRVTVLTADRQTFAQHTGLDESLEASIHPLIDVVRVPFEWPYPVKERSQWSWSRRLAPRLWWRSRVLLDQVSFPEKVYGRWCRRVVRSATAIQAQSPVHLVVATANPNVDFSVARHLHRRFAVPYVLDYRDAWLLDVFSGRQVHSDRSRAARLEKALIAHAKEIWFVNEPIRQWHANRYPEAKPRMHVVANGYDLEVAPGPRFHASTTDRLRFGYVGTVTGKVPIQQFAAGWTLARQRSDVLDRATAEVWGYLGFHRGGPSNSESFIANQAKNGLIYAGPLNRSSIRQTYERFDALLLLLGAGRYVTSGKVYEYIASALPIVSVHPPDNAASDILHGYPLWFPVRDLQPESIADALIEAARAARITATDVREQCAEFARQFSRELQLSPRINSLAMDLAQATVELNRPMR